jgi:hypothetical protein
LYGIIVAEGVLGLIYWSMKKFSYILMALAILASTILSMVSCESSDKEIYPFALEIYVRNSAGKNLLNPSVSGNITNNKISITYQGKTYQKDSTVTGGGNKTTSDGSTTYNFFGLQTAVNSAGEKYLAFGEIDASVSVTKETLVIDWGDGTKDEIAYTNQVGKNNVTRSLYINGDKVSKLLFTK